MAGVLLRQLRVKKLVLKYYLFLDADLIIPNSIKTKVACYLQHSSGLKSGNKAQNTFQHGTTGHGTISEYTPDRSINSLTILRA